MFTNRLSPFALHNCGVMDWEGSGLASHGAVSDGANQPRSSATRISLLSFGWGCPRHSWTDRAGGDQPLSHSAFLYPHLLLQSTRPKSQTTATKHGVTEITEEAQRISYYCCRIILDIKSASSREKTCDAGGVDDYGREVKSCAKDDLRLAGIRKRPHVPLHPEETRWGAAYAHSAEPARDSFYAMRRSAQY
jgi:hypothetical protein